MLTNIEDIRDADGQLPKRSWPGLYPLYYLTADRLIVCAECASREVDPQQRVTGVDVNWEEPDLLCEDCGAKIKSAYAD